MTPSYGELAALVAEQAVLIEALRVELEALRRQVGRDSSNSSQPPSTDGLAAKAKARAKADKPPAEQELQPSPDGQSSGAGPGRPRRTQGGQPGHRGSGLALVATPDKREQVEHLHPGGDRSRCTGQPAPAARTAGRLDRLQAVGSGHRGQTAAAVSRLPALLALGPVPARLVRGGLPVR